MRPTVPRAVPHPRPAGEASAPQQPVADEPAEPPVETGPAGPVTAPAAAPAVEDVAGAEVQAALAMVLVQRAQAGDVSAFGELYDRYVDTVYRYVALRVGSRALAEDLTSETFVRALARLDSFRWQGRDVGAWFVTIARNLVADHYKSSRYRLELPTDALPDADPAPAAEGPEDAVLAQLQTARVLDAVRRLGSEQQECVALRFLQGMSVTETARVMGKKEPAVRALQHRAVRALGRLLQDARPDDPA